MFYRESMYYMGHQKNKNDNEDHDGGWLLFAIILIIILYHSLKKSYSVIKIAGILLLAFIILTIIVNIIEAIVKKKR